MHELFENLDFTHQDKDATRELIADKLREHAFESSWAGPVYDMLQKVLEVPLDSVDGSFTLSQVHSADRLNELEFYFPLQRLSENRSRDIFNRYLEGMKVAELPVDMGRLIFRSVEGFMKGFIDLVFRFQDRYYIVDWKSNFLGWRTEDYDQVALQKAMKKGFYHLQYHLYTIAVHKFLRTRIPEYRYESHFGGVFYLFLRGVDPARGKDYGVYQHRPAAASIEALCSHLTGQAEW